MLVTVKRTVEELLMEDGDGWEADVAITVKLGKSEAASYMHPGHPGYADIEYVNIEKAVRYNGCTSQEYGPADLDTDTYGQLLAEVLSEVDRDEDTIIREARELAGQMCTQ